MSAAQVDDLDLKLIDILSRDARLSNRQIASQLGVTEGTVRGRIKRLQEDGLIAFTAITSFGLADRSKLALIGIQSDATDARAIADRVAQMPDINAVLVTMGRFNILAVCLFNELSEVHHIASEQILAMKEVHHVETTIAVHTIKYNARIVRITNDAAATDKGD